MADNDYVRVICRACDGEGCTICGLQGWVEVRPSATVCPQCGDECCIYYGYTGWSELTPKIPEQEAVGVEDRS